jgi:hypothetical protein
LTYMTFRHKPTLPPELEEFLSSCVNRASVVADYLSDEAQWFAAVRIRLPLGGYRAWLLTQGPAAWVSTARTVATDALRAVLAENQFAALGMWMNSLPEVPIPQLLLHRFDDVLSDEQFQANWLSLKT